MKRPRPRKARILALVLGGAASTAGLTVGPFAGFAFGNWLDALLGHPLGKSPGFFTVGDVALLCGSIGAVVGAVLPAWAVLRLMGGYRGAAPPVGLLVGLVVGLGVASALGGDSIVPYWLAASLCSSLGGAAGGYLSENPV